MVIKSKIHDFHALSLNERRLDQFGDFCWVYIELIRPHDWQHGGIPQRSEIFKQMHISVTITRTSPCVTSSKLSALIQKKMENCNAMPISVLREKSRCLLSKHLNTIKVFVSQNGYPRDYRGVLQSIGLNKFLSAVQTKSDPMTEVLKLWLNNKPKSATILQLRNVLGNIDRWDVIDDTNEYFVEDSIFYLNGKAKAHKRPTSINSIELNDMNILTAADVLMAERGLPPTIYDAYLLFHDEDIEFATTIVDKMQEYGLTIFLKERDLLAGNMESDSTMRIISERCKRLVVLFSEAFFSKQSNLDDFLLKYAQSIGIEKQERKIVPVCISDDCVIPSQFSMYFGLKYRDANRFKFWEQLRDSIRAVREMKPRIGRTNLEDARIVTPPAEAVVNQNQNGYSDSCNGSKYKISRVDNIKRNILKMLFGDRNMHQTQK